MRCAQREHGFSLIELLIVVAIILVIAAIAVPSLLRSRISANEASAVQSLRAVTAAQASYASLYPTLGYADVLTKLRTPASGDDASPTAAGFLDWLLACSSQPCLRSGYNFSIVETDGSPINSYRVIGVPARPGISGVRGFCSDQQGRISFDSNGGSACTTPLQ